MAPFVLIVIDETEPRPKKPKPKFYGPFPSEGRARLYATSLENGGGIGIRWTIQEMVCPYAVVKNIVWR